MADKTNILWTDSTWSPWLGCRRVSEGCVLCYIIHTTPFRTRKLLHGDERVELSPDYWKQPLRWNKLGVCVVCGARQHRNARQPHELPDGTICGKGDASVYTQTFRRIRVFPSLCDWLDDEVPVQMLATFLDLIRRTPNIDWQLLTKRPQNWRARLESALDYMVERMSVEDCTWLADWLGIKFRGACNPRVPGNVWIGVSTENQKRADERIPLLLGIPAGSSRDAINAAWRELSKRLHPDVGGSTAEMAALNQARNAALKGVA